MAKEATEILKKFYDSINFDLYGSVTNLYVSKTIIDKYKKENNLEHVKGKIYFNGIELKHNGSRN